MLTAQLLSEILQVEWLPAMNKKEAGKDPVQIAGDTVIGDVANTQTTQAIFKSAVLFTFVRNGVKKKDVPKFPAGWTKMTVDEFSAAMFPTI